MKICNNCHQTKDFEFFSKAARNIGGLCHQCKDCRKDYYAKNRLKVLEQKKDYYKENREKILEYKQEYYELNSEELVLKKRRYRELNPDTQKIWASKNKDKVANYTSKRRAKKLQATPKWLTVEQIAEIDFYYWFCQLVSEDTGIKHHVDHIVPLQGKTVCGLHVPWNLQILSASENCSKSNKLI
jgi:hypothetical protein